MDVLNENEALTAVFGNLDPSDLNFEQLEDFIINDEEVYFPDITQQTPVQYSNPPPPPLPPMETSSPINIVSKQQLINQPHTVSLKQNVDNNFHKNLNVSVPENKEFLTFQPGTLPESPPDSSSEPYSPPEVKPELTNGPVHVSQSQPQVQPPQPSPQATMAAPPPGAPILYTQQATQVQTLVPRPVPPQMQPQMQVPSSLSSYITPNPPQLSHLPTTEAQQGMLDGNLGHQHKKRKHSDSPNNTVTANTIAPGMINLVQIKQEPDTGSRDSDLEALDGVFNDCGDYDYGNDPRAYMENSFQCIKWQPFKPNKWHTLVDAAGKDLPAPSYRVEADKGFNFSIPDDAFVCQKKNHFQVTVHIGLAGHPKYVKMEDGLKVIESYYLHLYGVKVESVDTAIKIEQSQSDRSKKPFHPVVVDLPLDQVTKVTVGRLHFSETTSNNMRKKGKPNPDQRYFMLVVGLHVHSGGESYQIGASMSERIIVRASNPGQFENDVDMLWQKGQTPDSVYHVGRVGINTDRPEEQLTVHGDVRVAGNILQPSDIRVKENIEETDSKEQLRRVAKLRLVQYNYKPEYAAYVGMMDPDRKDTGVLAQDVKDILPEAVKETGDLLLPNGHKVDNFLIVNKDRIFMENIGAVKELCKLTDNLENRIDELEKMNSKLSKLKRLDSVKSTSSGGTISRSGGSNPPSIRRRDQRSSSCRRHHERHHHSEDTGCLSQKFMQGVIIALILIMLFCVAAMATLYALELESNKQTGENGAVGGELPLQGQNLTSTFSPFTPLSITPHKGPFPPNASLPSVSPTTMSTTPHCVGCKKYCCVPLSSTVLPVTRAPTPGEPDDLPFISTRVESEQGLDFEEMVPVLDMVPSPTSLGNSEFIADQDFSDREIDTINITDEQANVVHGEEELQQGAVIYKEPPSGSSGNRKKRAGATPKPETPLVVTSIRITDGDYPINQDHCDFQQCGNGNYSYTISVPAYFPLKSTNLEINTSIASMLWFCEYTPSPLCLDVQKQPEPLQLPDGHVKKSHQHSLPIGYYFESSYKFRITYPSHTSTTCESTDGTFLDYFFHFKRNMTACYDDNGTIN
ncbi:myelin regulatory factor-like isoform X1 [Ptychodera flava]|uniref:myelin regulatory factor-like isoform X1 n=1 Tax=Ptychodera flava TaxID=63121 RepID=UPI00396A4CE4